MAELSLKQIEDKLNTEFVGDLRKLVFWYDENGEFAEDVDSLQLNNARVLHLEQDNQFYTKYFLECVDTETNYLIYAPFPKPSLKENHLADTLRYSKEFFADRASLITLDLDLDESLKPEIQRYIKFFSAKDRQQKFYDLHAELSSRAAIEIAIMSVLCKIKVSFFEEVVRSVLTESSLEENTSLKEFKRYGLLQAFWQQCAAFFGYSDEKPTLVKLMMTAFVTYANNVMEGEIPDSWKPYIAEKAFHNVMVFMDHLMNSAIYGERFDELSAEIFKGLNGAVVLKELPPEALLSCNLFTAADDLLIRWIIARLECEDTDAKLKDMSIPEICEHRRKMHFGSRFENEYAVLEFAYRILAEGNYVPVSGADRVAKQYMEHDYNVDRWYRQFYLHFDRLETITIFEKLRELVENFYTNEFLDDIVRNWTRDFAESNGRTGLESQTGFYSNHVRHNKERTVVIISDAMRYEVGRSLFERLESDEKCSVRISGMQSVLPSFTRFGMAALLPHHYLSLDDEYRVCADGQLCDSLGQRELVLQKVQPKSRCVQFDDIKAMKKAELREVFSGQSVVYVYHNQIDARGDKPNTENEVFVACEEAINEIHNLIKRLTTSANTTRFVVTADHGFIYKRDKLTESDKISGIAGAAKRFIVTNTPLIKEGVASIPFKEVIGQNDSRFVNFPMGADLFKSPGAGLNYVHGGCSPQELIIPVIDVKTEKGHKDTAPASIALISINSKVTNLITTLDFVQTEPVSDVIKEAKYRICFVDAAGNKISNEHIYLADKTDPDTLKRVFRLKFTIKSGQYDRSKKYYIVALNETNGMEVLRHEMVIDILFSDDFGFDL